MRKISNFTNGISLKKMWALKIFVLQISFTFRNNAII